MIGFTLTDKQQAVRERAAAVGKEILSQARSVYSQHHDQLSRFRSTLPVYQKAVKVGLVKGQVPVELGGSSESFIDSAIVIEELYAVEPSVMLSVAATGLGLLPLILGGTPEQKERFLKPFITGEGEPLASLAHSEPTGTANWLERGGKGLGVTARREGDHYIVNGEKMWTSNSAGWDGRGATLCNLCCRYSETGGPEDPNVDPVDNIMILMVTRDVVAANPTEAYQLLEEIELMGHEAVSGPTTRYTNFKVPIDHVLAEPGTGQAVIEKSFCVSGAFAGAMAVGTMRRAFETALKFSKTDKRGGTVPIIERQSVADLLINIKVRIDTSRLMVWKALDALTSKQEDPRSAMECCLQAKIYCSDQAVPTVYDAMQVVGMTSYSKKSILPSCLNDAMIYPLFDGGNLGIRRRQYEKILQAADYDPWSSVF